MKKIPLLIAYQIDPLGKKVGGIETFIRNFIKYAPEDFDIELLGITSDQSRRPVRKWQEVSLYGRGFRFLPVLYVEDENIMPRIPLSLKFTFALRLNKDKIRPEDKIMEFHRIEPALSLTRCNARRVLFIHGNMMDLYNPHSEVRWSHFPWFYFQLEKRLIKKMSRIYLVREDGAEFYKKRYSQLKDKISFLPAWVDDDMFFPIYHEEKRRLKDRFLSKYALESDSKLIMFCGRIEGQKDPLLLVETFHHLSQSEKRAKLILVGTGTMKGQVEKHISSLAMKDRVVFLGVLPQTDVAELMRISDVLLLTSAFEGMPRAAVEALACGLPVVSTNVGEANRIVKKGISGLVTDNRSPEALAKAVLDIFNSSHLYTPSKCVSCIKPYLARDVLVDLYQAYQDLWINN